MPQLDWSQVEKDMRLHIVENAKTYIETQIGLATAADQRAAALAGAFTAAGTALIAGLIAFGTASVSSPEHKYPIFIGGSVAAASFVLAGLLCVMAIMPVEVYLPGGQPQDWYDDIRAKVTYDACLEEEATILQDKISYNRRC